MSSISTNVKNLSTSVDTVDKIIKGLPSRLANTSRSSIRRGTYCRKAGASSVNRIKWKMFAVQVTKIFGDSKDNELYCKHMVRPAMSKNRNEENSKATNEKKPNIMKETIISHLGSLWTEDEQHYLYRIDIKQGKPNVNTSSHMCSPENSSHQFGILVPNKLPHVPQFPIYSKSGEMLITFTLLNNNLYLTKENWELVLNFHEYTFSKFLRIVEFPMEFSPNFTDSSIIIVPLDMKQVNINNYEIDWRLLKKLEDSDNVDKFVLEGEIEKCRDTIIMPRYIKQTTPQYFHVVGISKKLTPTSKFPSDRYDTYAQYYLQEFQKEINDLEQPLLETYAISEHVNALKRRDENRKGFALPARRTYTKEISPEMAKQMHKIYHVPELCDVHPFPAPLWKIAWYLPSILYRLNGLLLADNLREEIAKDINIYNRCTVFKEQLPVEHHWPALIFERPTKETCEKNNIIRNTTCVVEIKDKPNHETHHSGSFQKSSDKLCFSFDSQPILSDFCGPSPALLLHTITTSNSEDALDLDRLKSLGEAFIKYITIAMLFSEYPSDDVRELGRKKEMIVSNENLARLGNQKDIGRRMIATRFNAKNKTWLPPCYYVPEALEESLITSDLPPQNWNISDMINMDDSNSIVERIPKIKDYPSKQPYKLLSYQYISDKNIVNCVEALVGAYLVASGPQGAHYFMQWIGFHLSFKNKLENNQFRVKESIKSRNNNGSYAVKSCENISDSPTSLSGLSTSPFHDHRQFTSSQDDPYLSLYKKGKYSSLEKSIGYKFKNPKYLIQAFTHESYYQSREFCYERLEFLGDAVIDYLVTRHLFEDPITHYSGKMFELRSALVNNNIFASLAVQNSFHNYLNMSSKHLKSSIDHFVSFDLMKDDYYSSWNCASNFIEGVEDVEAPKVLSDVFEALSGAIYLDSGCKLDSVWKVYNKMMENKIAEYSKNIPKPPVSSLQEIFPGKVKFGKSARLSNKGSKKDEKCKVSVSVEVQGIGVYKGIGRDEKLAKSTAAKFALHAIRNNPYLISMEKEERKEKRMSNDNSENINKESYQTPSHDHLAVNREPEPLKPSKYEDQSIHREPHRNLKRKIGCDENIKTKATRTCEVFQGKQYDANDQSITAKFSVEGALDAIPAFAEVVSTVPLIGKQAVRDQIHCQNRAEEVSQLLLDKPANGHFQDIKNLTRSVQDDTSRLNVVQHKNEDGEHAAYIAAKEGNLETLKMLIEDFPIVLEKKSHLNRTPLHGAAMSGHSNICEYLVNKRAYVDAEDKHRRTALMLAAHEGHLNVVEILLKCNANIRARDVKRNHAAYDAASNGHVNIVKLIIEKDPGILEVKAEFGRTLLIEAAHKGHFNICNYLVRECKVDINAEDENDYTVLMLSEYEGHVEIAKFLMENGATIKSKDKVECHSACHSIYNEYRHIANMTKTNRSSTVEPKNELAGNENIDSIKSSSKTSERFKENLIKKKDKHTYVQTKNCQDTSCLHHLNPNADSDICEYVKNYQRNVLNTQNEIENLTNRKTFPIPRKELKLKDTI